MWVLIVCATDGWAAGTPDDSAWVQDTGGIAVRASFAPTPETGDTGDSADSAESADTGETPVDTDTDPVDTDTDTDGGVDTDTDPNTDGGDDDGESDAGGCCGSDGTESNMVLGVALALAVVLGRRRTG
jgi:hypothetical protein